MFQDFRGRAQLDLRAKRFLTQLDYIRKVAQFMFDFDYSCFEAFDAFYVVYLVLDDGRLVQDEAVFPHLVEERDLLGTNIFDL